MNKINIIASTARQLANLANTLTFNGNFRNRRNNKTYTRKMWIPNYYNVRSNYRKRGINNQAKLEINRAEGGYKQVYNNGRVQQQTIEIYKTIGVSGNLAYIFTDTQSDEQLNVQSLLNDNSEFLELRRTCLQYKIKMLSFSFNYNRIPQSQDKFSKMLISPETDMVLQASDPKLNNNTMVWDMTSNGSKNYNFRINNRNTEKQNQEWQISEAQWNAVCILHLTQQGEIFIKDRESVFPVQLGEIKIAVSVVYVKADTENNNRVHLTTSNILNTIAEENRNRIEQKAKINKIEQNKKKILQLEEANKLLDVSNNIIV